MSIDWQMILIVADSYILQLQRIETPVDPTPSTPALATQTPLPPPPLPIQSIFASKSPQSGTIALLNAIIRIPLSLIDSACIVDSKFRHRYVLQGSHSIF
jgi:hypothetical protein